MRKFWAILAYGRAYRTQLILSFVFLVLFNLFGIFSLGMAIPFLQILFEPGQPTQPVDPGPFQLSGTYIKAYGEFWITENILAYGKMQVLYLFSGVLFLLVVIKNFFRLLSSWVLAPVEQGVIEEMRNVIFDHLNRLGLPYYTRMRKGGLMTLVVNDVQIIQEAVIGTLMPLFRDPLSMLFLLLAMLFLSWKLTLFTLLVLPLTGYVISRVNKSLKKRARRGQANLDVLVSYLDEFLSGIRIVRAFAAEQYVRRRYREINGKYSHEMVRFRERESIASPVNEVLTILVVLVIILYGGSLIVQGASEMSGAQFIGFIIFFSQFIAPIKTFTSALNRVQKALVSYDRVKELLDEPVRDAESDTGQQSVRLKHGLSIRKLRFRYEPDSKEVLKGIQLEIKKGEKIALVGPSGGGKSTLADLIARFHDPTEGAILLDGTDYRNLNATALRSSMGIVTQEAILFNDTVYHNIAFGRPDTPLERVIAAAKIANAHDFILQMEQGYDTLIGERGGALSGGQRQRLCIARAILHNPDILILDEATSALDNQSEKIVQQALDRIMEGRTSIIIAHRLSTVRNVDRIVVIEAGVMVEEGTHEALLAKGGVYARLYEMQFQV
ncbi:MAG: ABC transporter ATP-binding protein [Sphingobacteriia bacterium]